MSANQHGRTEEVAIAGLALYGATLGLVLGLVWWVYSYRSSSSEDGPKSRRGPPFTSPKNLFFFFISCFLLCRLAWFAVDGWSPERISDYILNRAAIALFFTAFTLVIFFWADTIHAMRHMAERPSEAYAYMGFLRSWKARVAFLLVNGAVYAGQVVFITLFLVLDHNEREAGRHAYNVNILSFVAVFGIVCLAFLGYGGGLLLASRRAMNTKLKVKFYVQTITVTGVLVVCFAVRLGVFLYRPIVDDYIPEWLFVTLAYMVPELIPTVVMAVVLSRSLRRQIAVRERSEWFNRTYSRLGSKGYAEPLITHDDDDDDLVHAALSAPIDDDDDDDDDPMYGESYGTPPRLSVNVP